MIRRIKKIRNTTSFKFAFRISGFCYKDAEGNIIRHEGRGFGMNISQQHFFQTLRQFFVPKAVRDYKRQPSELLDSIEFCKRAIQFFEDINNQYEFLSSSILFCKKENQEVPKIKAKFIDFAHVYRLGFSDANLKYSKRDQNYLDGLRGLLQCLQILLDECTGNKK